MLSEKPRVLLSAYQCGPKMGSVSQIGWEWFSRLSKRVPVTLVTHIRNRINLSAAGVDVESEEIIFIDTEWLAKPLYSVAQLLFPKSQHSVFLLSSLDYFFFDNKALKTLRRRMKSGQSWDVVHIPTPVSPVAPSRLHRLGPPVVWGPLNGGLASPKGFDSIMKDDSDWLYSVRHLGRLVDKLIGSSREAAMILCATKSTFENFPTACRNKCVPMIENGLDPHLFNPAEWPEPPSSTNPLRLLFVGRLVPFKGIPLLLNALKKLGDGFPFQVRIVGDGPMKIPWEAQVQEKGLSKQVTFTGALPIEAINEQLAWCHAFTLPSVRESGGAVLLEAMASGRPVIALNFGGPAETVDEEVGCALPITGGESEVENLLAETMRDVFNRPAVWRDRGTAGIGRAVSLYSWDAKIQKAIDLYGGLLN